MTVDAKIAYGTRPWFEMIGEVMCGAATAAKLDADVNFRLVEHFVNGDDWGDGLFEGFRLDIVKGEPSFQVGVRPGEFGDLTVNVTRAASRTLNTLHGYDPGFEPALQRLTNAGEFEVVNGNLSDLFELIGPIHDEVVDRTAA